MSDIIEVTHRINYDVNDASLQNAAKAIRSQIDELARLNAQLNDYTKQFNALMQTQSDGMDRLGKKVDVLNGQLIASASKTQSVLSSVFKGFKDGMGLKDTLQGSVAKYVEDVKSKFSSLTKASAETSKSISGMWSATSTATAGAAGKTASSLLNLGKSLVSTTGLLGLGVNLLLTFGEEMLSAGDKTEKLNVALEESAKFSRELGQAAGSEIAKLISLKSKVEDITLSYDKRLQAAKDLQQLYPEYFGNLSKEEIMAGKVADAYDRVSQSIIAVAKNKVYQAQLESLVSRYTELEDSVRKEEDRTNTKLHKTIDSKTGLPVYNIYEPGSKNSLGTNYVQPTDQPRQASRNVPLQPVDNSPKLDTNKVSGDLITMTGLLYQIKSVLANISDNDKNLPKPKLASVGSANTSSDKRGAEVRPKLTIPIPTNPDEENIPDEFNTTKKSNLDVETEESRKLKADTAAAKEKDRLEAEEKKRQEEALVARKVHTQQMIDDYKNFASEAIKAINAVYEAQLKMLDKEIEMRKERVSKAEELAERGNTEILRMEKEQLEKAQAEREKKAKQQLQLNALIQASNQAVALSEAIGAIVSAAAKGDPYTIALRVAAAVAALVAGIASLTGAFSNAHAYADGVVDFKGKGGPRDDANWVRISSGESVITAEGTRNNRQLLEAINSGAKLQFMNPALAFTMPAFASPDSSVQRFASRYDLKTVETKLDGVINAIEDNRMKQNIYFNEHGVGIMTERAVRKTKQRWM
ncbi:MAG: hypothetical protein J0L80_06715 [Chitinophagales bacterium]|nr:hypothetical protein [Chitinophagales bacterium]